MTDPVTVRVWRQVAPGSASWAQVSEIRTWTDLELEPRHNQPGPWSIRLPWDGQTFRLSKTDLVTFDFRGTRLTGLIESYGAASDEQGQPVLEASGVDTLALLGDVTAWPDPASPLGTQNTVRYRASGPAETVLRSLILANVVTRLGRGVAIPASTGRGGTINVVTQFGNLLEIVVRKCAAAGLGVRMGLVNTTSSTRAEMRCEFYVPVNRSTRVRLSHKARTLRSWRQSDQVPTATRAIVAAASEETSLDIDTVNTALNRLTITGKDNVRHHLRTGSLIRFSGGGTPPAPLRESRAYYAIRVDADTFKVATTRSRASAGLEIGLTNAGSGNIKVTETTRIFRYVTNAAAETEWGRVRETLVSASVEDDAAEDVYTEQGNEALTDAAGQSSFDLEAVEAEGMRVGTHYGLGDLVTVELLTGVSQVEALGAFVVSASASDGVSVRLIPGNPDAGRPLFGQAAIIRGIRQQVRTLQSEEG